MKPISIPDLGETPKVGLKTIKKVLSIAPKFEPNNPTDLIEVLKRTKPKFAVTSFYKAIYDYLSGSYN